MEENEEFALPFGSGGGGKPRLNSFGGVGGERRQATYISKASEKYPNNQPIDRRRTRH